jgi:hypothetical protein
LRFLLGFGGALPPKRAAPPSRTESWILLPKRDDCEEESVRLNAEDESEQAENRAARPDEAMRIARQGERPPADGNGKRISAQLPGPGDPVQADALAERLVEEMKAAWQQGQRPVAEDFFSRHP